MRIGVYGPRVVGEEEFRRQKEVVARAAQIYGPRVTGGRAEAKTTAEPPKAAASAPPGRAAVHLEAERLEGENGAHARAPQPAAPTAGGGDGELSEPPSIEGAGGDEAVQAAAGADAYLSVAELRAAVTANPALVDVFLERELARQPKPRVSALRALLDTEQSEGGARRPEIVAKIKAALGEATR